MSTIVEQDQESLLTFPSEFPIKVMGLNDEKFPTEIEELIVKFVPNFDANNIKVGYSKTKKYMALTVTIIATSKEQLDAIYMALTSHPMVKVAL